MFAFILLSYFSILVVSPAVCSVYLGIDAIEFCGTNDSCTSSADIPNDSNDGNLPCADCCIMGCCECDYFLMDTNDGPSEVLSGEKKMLINNENAHSSYLSKCWKPPKSS